MKVTILLFISFCFFTFSSSAQNIYSVKGAVVDTSVLAKLSKASVSVLNAKDSTLHSFTRSHGDGSFTVDNLTKGKFILLVTYPGYADYTEHFSLDSVNNTHNFGSINMLLKAKLLADVMIKGTRAQIKIKGDTTEFDAKAYKTQPNASVEDLLKQLQGITVDKDGKITAQGQTVNKVLVDGEEFFGDDPTLVTKNLRADMVDKVQLYDKKSDQATFTGIDDGQKSKTINIKLKEDKKNGYFGKVDAGYGTDKYYQSQVLFNRFKGKQKFSFFSTVSNDGKTGLGWQDNQKYGSSDNITVMDDGGLMISGGGGDDLDSWNGNYDGKGIPIAINNGVHYDSKFNKDKESINLNYKLGMLTVDGTDNTLSQTGGIFNTNSNQKFHNYIFRNKLDVTYQVKLDTTSNLKVMVDGTTKHTTTRSNYLSSVSNMDTLKNISSRDITNTTDTKIFDASLFYTKKFQKKGRTFSWNLSANYNEAESKGNLKTDVDYYNPLKTIDSSRIVDQYKTKNTVSTQLNSNMTYTEPIFKSFSVVINYGLGINNSSADRKSFDKAGDGSYSIFDPAYSNNYKLNQLQNQVGAIFNYAPKNNTLNFGAKVSDVNFKQVNEYTNNVFKRDFVQWAPQLNYSHKFSQNSSVRFEYSGKSTQPTVDQIQPVLENTDPLNVIIGSPTLTPSFTHNFRLSYNSYKVLADQYVFFYGNYSLTSNPIVDSTVAHTSGKDTTRYININRTPYNYYYGINFGRKIGPIGIGFDVNGNGNKSYNLLNNKINIITGNTYSGRLHLQRYVEKKYDFNVSFGPSLTYGGSSQQIGINNNGHGWVGDGGFSVYLPWKLALSSDGSYQYNSKTQTFDQSYTRFLWNARLEKSFDKEEKFKISLVCNDILNQNSGFERSNNGNQITQDRYTTIKRFFMITAVWNFTKVGGAVAKK